jgi:parvulin-like peptidyl-prolyl isomerase
VVAGLVVVLSLFVGGCGVAVPSDSAAQSASSAPSRPAAASTPMPSASPPAAASTQPLGGATQDGRPLVARINGQPIFLDVYQKQLEQTEKALADQGMLAADDAGGRQRAQLRENVLQGLIDQALIEQVAATMGITVTDEELEISLQNIATQGEGSFEQWLTANHMTMDELRIMQRAQLIASKLITAVSVSVPGTAEQVHARHIFVADRAKADSISERLRRDGADQFGDLSQRESEDASTAADGGDLGWFPIDAPMVPPVVVQVAFSLQVGEVSDPVQGEVGYHIVKVEAREADRPLSPEMLLYAQQRAFETWLAEQRAKARIERFQAE